MALDDLLLSTCFKARGQINKEFIFYVVNQEQRQRAYVVPTDPKTPAQLSWRSFWRNGMSYWKNQTQNFKDEYNLRAKQSYPRMLGFNLFMRDWVNEVYAMNVVKQIQRGKQFVPQGLTNITINAVDLSKSILICNSFLSSLNAPPVVVYGVEGASLTSPTNIGVIAWDTAGTGTVAFTWQVIEFF